MPARHRLIIALGLLVLCLLVVTALAIVPNHQQDERLTVPAFGMVSSIVAGLLVLVSKE